MKTVNKNLISRLYLLASTFLTALGTALVICLCIDERFMPLKSNLLPISIGAMVIGAINIITSIYFGYKCMFEGVDEDDERTDN